MCSTNRTLCICVFLMLSLFCSLLLLLWQTGVSFHPLLSLFLVASSVLLWDRHPGSSGRRRLWCNPAPPHYLCDGEVLQEKAHGKRHWDALTGAGVEGPNRLVRTGERGWRSSPPLPLGTGVAVWEETKGSRGRRCLFFHVCLSNVNLSDIIIVYLQY